MLEFARQYGYNVYSQNNEDGIIEEILDRIRLDDKYGTAIEFGGADGYYFSNIRNLEKRGWELMQYDKEPSGPVKYKFITENNINDLLQCDVMSIDIDGNDFQVWKAEKTEHDIVIIEINSSLDPLADHWSLELGCNYSKMVKLGEVKGYFTLCHTGNIIFVNREHIRHFPEWKEANPLDIDLFFNKSWL